jgi:polysaccharide biosynthesis protein PslH
MKGKVLQICKKTPVPAKDGESIAIRQMTQMLSLEYDVTVLAMTTPKHNVSDSDNADYVAGVKYHFVEVNTDISITGAFLNLFSSKPYITERFYSEAFEQKLIQILKSDNYDFIQLEGIFPGIYLHVIRKYSNAKVVLRAHNVEHIIWQRMARQSMNGLKKLYLNNILIPRFADFEKKLSERVEAIVAISPVDEIFFRQNSSAVIQTVPVGYGLFPQSSCFSSVKNIGYLGALDWLPNIEGLQWFLNNVWSKFNAQYPDVTFSVAGRNKLAALDEWNYNNVEIVGEVPVASEFIASNQIMVVPLLSGSGMRIKIIEAMALGKCVVSTSVGAEGIEAESGKHIFLADSADEWLKCLADVVNNPPKALKIGENAQNFIKEFYHIDGLSKKLLQFYSQIP